MGLTVSSTGAALTNEPFSVKCKPDDKIVAIAGNPNVGKSTLFNALTGMRQHTGNWPGKTVATAQGYCHTKKNHFLLVDIPGTYSLFTHSPEEEIARDFICSGIPKLTVVVCDATCLQRNLVLALQILEVTKNVIVCVNLLDEAERKGIKADLDALSLELGVPVVGTVAKNKKSLKKLLSQMDKSINQTPQNVYSITYPKLIEDSVNETENALLPYFDSRYKRRATALKLISGYDITLPVVPTATTEEITDTVKSAREKLFDNGFTEESIEKTIASSVIIAAEQLSKKVIKKAYEGYNLTDRRLDKLFTGKKTGFLLMILFLLFIFWLTVWGANYISAFLSDFFNFSESQLNTFLIQINTPDLLRRILIEGIYRVPAWIVSVMLPPMAIFFPLFTLLEDSGYLPRVAYNLDKPFKRCNSCGKQALTMCMGLGCNAAGVIGGRIIDSPRERLLAIITNSLVPCNGRFPAIIALISMFFITARSLIGSITSALILTTFILASIGLTLLSTKLLSKTLLKGVNSSYILEMPPYRKPKIGSVIIRSIFDRTIFVLGRALSVSIPAGIIIWIMANVTIGDTTLLNACADFLDPFGSLIGLDGVILMAFVLGFPANEIVLPIIVMAYLSNGSLSELCSLGEIKEILVANGWTPITALCTITFSLFHWPCSTTVLTIKKETESLFWTAVSVVYPTVLGITVCFVINMLSKLIF